jgi:hypothetical protein
MSVPEDGELDCLRGAVAANPSDARLRLDLGVALWRRHDYTAAIPELQRAMTDVHWRRPAGKLLAKIFEEEDLPDIAEHIRRSISDDPQDEGGSAPMLIPTTPRSPRPGASVAKPTRRDDNNA